MHHFLHYLGDSLAWIPCPGLSRCHNRWLIWETGNDLTNNFACSFGNQVWYIFILKTGPGCVQITCFQDFCNKLKAEKVARIWSSKTLLWWNNVSTFCEMSANCRKLISIGLKRRERFLEMMDYSIFKWSSRKDWLSVIKKIVVIIYFHLIASEFRVHLIYK